MSFDEDFGATTERKIRFRPPAKVLFNTDAKIEDLLRPEKDEDETDNPKKAEKRPSLLSFLQVEVTRDYLLEHDEERFSARREKVYSFMKIPREVERFVRYGFVQCTDSFLFVYTFLPMRVLLALWALMTRPVSHCFGLQNRRNRGILTPAEICDLLKAVILVFCSMFMFTVDTNMLYHLIKSQSVIKLYIFYNMLEVADRLFSAFGQDTIDALFWTATEPRGRKREHLGVIPHLIFAIVYVILHSILVLVQATTLNVAINSNNKALLTIMMSNNFVELKGSVFKKFDKNNLFQVSCSDVRERFHLIVLLFIVVLQTMREYSWKCDRLWILLPDCFIVLVAEMFVDWIKHAFITRFNELQLDVYRDYTTSLAYDVAQTRQKHAFSDHSDLVARRMGFIPLPLGVVMIRVLASAVQINDYPSVILLILAYLCMVSFKILNSLFILGKACVLISQHKQEKATAQSPSSSNNKSSNATSPSTGIGVSTTAALVSSVKSASSSAAAAATNVNAEGATSSLKFTPTPVVVIMDQPLSARSKDEDSSTNASQTPIPTSDLGAAALFANSTVDLKNASLNEELLKVEVDEAQIESALEQNEIVTRSVPNINRELNKEEDSLSSEENNVISAGLKKSESEPSLNTALCNAEENDAVSK